MSQVDMRGAKHPGDSGEIAFDLLEPAVLAGRDKPLRVRTNTVVVYRFPGDTRDKREAISGAFEIPAEVVNELIDSFDRMKNGDKAPDQREAVVVAKYVYDMYGKLKLSAEFMENDDKAHAESKRRGIPLRKTSGARSLVRMTRLNPATAIAGFFLDLVFSGGSDGPPVMFVDP